MIQQKTLPRSSNVFFAAKILVKRQAPLFQTDKALLADDEMIQHFDVEQMMAEERHRKRERGDQEKDGGKVLWNQVARQEDIRDDDLGQDRADARA